jgi:tRNA modification GTPase
MTSRPSLPSSPEREAPLMVAGAEPMPADTIFALSSGRPPAAIAVIRVSGPGAHFAAEMLAGALPEQRRAVLRQLHSRSGDILDNALVLRFDRPASATGEDSVEFHCHGGRAVADAVLGALAEVPGVRAAEAGEFTRRAFANGRIDLTEAEGLADLLEAETEGQRRAALAVADGGLKRLIEHWRGQVVQLSARAEALIDYLGDEEEDPDPTLATECASLAGDLAEWVRRPRAEPLKDGVKIVIAGPPNSGKSSLLNAITGLEKAIVTPIAGTTRDHIEVPIALAGIPVVLTDTAGLRVTRDAVEAIGVERARDAAAAADIVLWLGDHEGAPGHQQLIHVHSRADLPGRERAPAGSYAVSAVTGAGLGPLLEAVSAAASRLLPAEGAIALNRRQARHIAAAADSLTEATDDPVLAAESLRVARAELDRLTGRSGFEDVLDELFGRFCLGK